MSKVVELEQESMELEKLLADYRDWIQGQGFTKNSAKDHQAHLSHWWRFLESRGLLAQERVRLDLIDRDVIADYQAYIFDYVSPRTGKQLSCNSQINALSYLITFFRFLESTGKIALNPSGIIKLPRHPQLLPAVLLKPEEMRRLLEVPNVQTVMGFRDRTFLEVLWTSAPRLGELIAVHAEDINHAEGLLTIREGKGSTQRVVPIGTGALAWVKEYIRAVRPLLALHRRARPSPILFLNRFGRPMEKSGWEYKMNVYTARARVNSAFTSHSFRHQLASDMLKNGADLRHIQQMLGHENLQTTQRYLHVVKAELARVHSQTHPKERVPALPVKYQGSAHDD